MMIVKQLLDKICFAIGVIVFLQLPHFIDQYTQRIGGYAESKIQQLEQYQEIAENNYEGNINLLIDNFKNSQDPAIQQTGESISETQQDVFVLNDEIKILETDGLFKKVMFLSTNLRYNIAKGTLGTFQPGIPLNIWAFVYGLIGGVLFSLLFNGTTKLPKLVMRKKSTSNVFTK
ncbi:MAG: DUF2937 family protein [Marinicellaceae bacterium]